MSHIGDMKPSTTELVILKTLWIEGTQSAREIHDAISTELGWSYSSTRKTIERMIAKDMLGVERSHGLKIYHAKLEKIPTLAAMIRNFAAEVLGLEGPLPVSNLVKSHLLNEAELEELDAFLKNADTRDEGAKP
jgi:BlaI family transcriptional regulator, penicillinase repressor